MKKYLKRNILILLILIGLISLNGCEESKTWKVNGKVKTLTESTYKIIYLDDVLSQGEMEKDGYKVWKFDSNGKIVESYTWELSQNYDRELIKTVNYSDSLGRHVKQYKFNNKGLKTKFTVEYNEDGSIATLSKDYPEGELEKIQDSIKKSGWMDVQKQLFKKGYENPEIENVISPLNKYEYDSQGNWIKCIVYTQNKPILIIYRDIEYYSYDENLKIENDVLPSITRNEGSVPYLIYVDTSSFKETKTISAVDKSSPLHKLILEKKGNFSPKDKKIFTDILLSGVGAEVLNNFCTPSQKTDLSKCKVVNVDSDLAKLYYLYDERGFISHNRLYYDEVKDSLIDVENQIKQIVQTIDKIQKKYIK